MTNKEITMKYGALRRILAIIIISQLMISNSLSSEPLSDIKGHWAEKNIVELIEIGAINGYSDGTFKPDDAIKRIEFIKVLGTSLGIKTDDKNVYYDTIDHWGDIYLSGALFAGLTEYADDFTYNNETRREDYFFRPDAYITREEMAIMMVKALAAQAMVDGYTSSSFSDVSLTKTVFYTETVPSNFDYIEAAYELGIITGYPNGTFGPDDTATRAQASVMITRMLKLLNEKRAQIMSEEALLDKVQDNVVKVSMYINGNTEYHTGLVVNNGDNIMMNLSQFTRSPNVLDEVTIESYDRTEKKYDKALTYDRARDLFVINTDYQTGYDLVDSDITTIGDSVYIVAYTEEGLSVSSNTIKESNWYKGLMRFELNDELDADMQGGLVFNQYGCFVGICSEVFGGSTEVNNEMIHITDIINVAGRDDMDIPVKAPIMDPALLKYGSSAPDIYVQFFKENGTSRTYYPELKQNHENPVTHGFFLNCSSSDQDNENLVQARFVFTNSRDEILFETPINILNTGANTGDYYYYFEALDLNTLPEGAYTASVYIGDHLSSDEEIVVVSPIVEGSPFSNISISVFNYDAYTKGNYEDSDTLKQHQMWDLGYRLQGKTVSSSQAGASYVMDMRITTPYNKRYFEESIEIDPNSDTFDLYFNIGDEDQLSGGYSDDYGQFRYGYYAGDYLIEVYYQDTLVASKTFEVTNKAYDINTITSDIRLSYYTEEYDRTAGPHSYVHAGFNMDLKDVEGIKVLEAKATYSSSNPDSEPVYLKDRNLLSLKNNYDDNINANFSNHYLPQSILNDYGKGYEVYINLYINGVLAKKSLLNLNDIPMNSEVIDGGLYASELDNRKSFYWMNAYSTLEKHEDERIDYDDEEYLYILCDFKGEEVKLYHHYADDQIVYNRSYEVAHYLRAELINEETGTLIYSKEWYYPNKYTNWSIIPYVNTNEIEGLAEGFYLLKLYDSPDGVEKVSKRYELY